MYLLTIHQYRTCELAYAMKVKD